MIQILKELQDKFDRIRESQNSLDHFNFLMEMIRAFENVRYSVDEEGKYHFHENIDWTPYIEFHYRLMTDKRLPDEARKNIRFRFAYHKENGGRYLLSKMDKNEDAEFYPDFIFSLGQIYQFQHIDGKEEALTYARKFALAEDTKLRENGISVLGWLGNESDFALLEDRMLNDPYSKCRAWAGAGFRFIKTEDKPAKVIPVLKKGIEHETDPFALGVMIEVAQELTKKRWISQKAVESIQTEAIQKGKEKALRYLNKQ